MIVQIKKITVGLFAAIVGAHFACAQSLGTDALPERPTAERLVREVPAVAAVPEAASTYQTESSNKDGESIVQTALQYLGARYRAGHSGPSAFDCSGFTSYIYKLENISISRSSRSQYQEGTPIRQIADLQKGDLVFFGGSRSRRTVGHVGIVTDVDPGGNGFKFIHAARNGVIVSDSNSAYYSRRYLGARRILPD